MSTPSLPDTLFERWSPSKRSPELPADASSAGPFLCDLASANVIGHPTQVLSNPSLPGGGSGGSRSSRRPIPQLGCRRPARKCRP